MGGNAITQLGYPQKRISKSEYETICNEVSDIIQKTSIEKFVIVPSYINKQDFGDCDILIQWNKTTDYRVLIEEHFHTKCIVNDICYSFPYQGFQIDFILTFECDFEIAYTYLSYNDVGNLCGRAFHALGLLYGQQGLFFKIREEHINNEKTNSHVMTSVCLSKDPRTILEFGGFNYDRFLHGFDTLEDMFDWVCKGRYFNALNFKYENLNYENRTRNKKRKTYQLFLEWLETNEDNYDQFKFNKNKNNLPMITGKFPVLDEELKKATTAYYKRKELYNKFNGKLVSEWTNLQSSDLGKAIHNFKNKFGSQIGLDKFVDSHTAKECKEEFLKFYHEFSNN